MSCSRPLFTKLEQMKAVNKFKKLVAQKRPAIMSSILDESDQSRFSQPPLSMQRSSRTLKLPHKSQSVTSFDRKATEGALVVEGVHRQMDILRDPPNATQKEWESKMAQHSSLSSKAQEGATAEVFRNLPSPSADQSPEQGSEQDSEPQPSQSPTDAEEEEQYLAFRPEHPLPTPDRARSNDEAGHRGHAHDPLQDHLYLYIGPSTFSGASDDADRRATFAVDWEEDQVPIVSESPGVADIDIYETAYLDEIERIRRRSREEGKDEEETTVYLTRRVDARLFAVSQLAGRFKAKGGEGLDRFGAATGWKDKKAKVTDVSRALRDAAREEYEKRRQERRQKGRAAAAEALKTSSGPNANTDQSSQAKEHEASSTEPPESGAARPRTSSIFAGKAMEKGKQAKTSLRSLMGMMKDRGNTTKEGNETS